MVWVVGQADREFNECSARMQTSLRGVGTAGSTEPCPVCRNTTPIFVQH